MLKLIYESRLIRLLRQRNRFVIFAMGLLVANIIQSIVIVSMTSSWHTVIVPTSISKSFWVGSSEVSESYLAEMTNYFASLVLNITPDNAAYQRMELLKYTDPNSYGVLKNQLIVNEDRIKQNNITTSFYPNDIKVDVKHLTTVITGDLKTYVGSQMTSTIRQSYVTKYTYHQGRLLISQFNEVQKDAF